MELHESIAIALNLPTQEEQEFIKCSLDPWYFLTNYYITIDEDGEERLFPDHQYLCDLIGLIHENNQVSVLKVRQMLFTLAVIGYEIYQGTFKKNTTSVNVSKTKPDAIEIVHRAHFSMSQLPEFFRAERVTPLNRGRIEWVHTGSRIISQPCTPDAVRTYTPQFVFLDEYAYQKYAKEVFQSCKPALNSNGKVVIGSTPSPLQRGAEFRKICLKGRKRGFVHMGISADMNPRKTKEFLAEQRAALGDERYRYEYGMCLERAGAGHIFAKEYNENKNVVTAFPVPKKWKRFRGIDWGPQYACIWFAIDPDPPHNIYAYRELYLRGQPTKIRARRMRQITGKDRIEWSVSDNAGPQEATDMSAEGITTIPCLAKNLMASIWLAKRILSGDGEASQCLYFFDICAELIGEIEEYTGDQFGYPIKHQGAHGVDCCRYFLEMLEFMHQQEDLGEEDDDFGDDDYETDNEYAMIDRGVVEDQWSDDSDDAYFNDRDLDI